MVIFYWWCSGVPTSAGLFLSKKEPTKVGTLYTREKPGNDDP
jgi:hypothetical protein